MHAQTPEKKQAKTNWQEKQERYFLNEKLPKNCSIITLAEQITQDNRDETNDRYTYLVQYVDVDRHAENKKARR